MAEETKCDPSDDSHRPVILLDVDGVINAFHPEWKRPHTLSNDCPMVMVRDDQAKWADLKADHIQSMRHTILVRWSPHVVQAVNKWSERADIIWVTSWRTAAAKNLAPAVGLKPFAVAPLDKHKYACHEEEFERLVRGRPVCWIDDEFNMYSSYETDFMWRFVKDWWGARRADPRCMLVGPTGPYGLSAEHLDAVDKFIELHQVVQLKMESHDGQDAASAMRNPLAEMTTDRVYEAYENLQKLLDCYDSDDDVMLQKLRASNLVTPNPNENPQNALSKALQEEQELRQWCHDLAQK